MSTCHDGFVSDEIIFCPVFTTLNVNLIFNYWFYIMISWDQKRHNSVQECEW